MGDQKFWAVRYGSVRAYEVEKVTEKTVVGYRSGWGSSTFKIAEIFWTERRALEHLRDEEQRVIESSEKRLEGRRQQLAELDARLASLPSDTQDASLSPSSEKTQEEKG